MSDSESTNASGDGDGDLQPSKLGTKEYWDDVYEREVRNFEEFGDEGEVWFGQESVEKIVDWVMKNVPPSPSPSSSHESGSPAGRLGIIEIGMGNGNLLFALVDAGYHDHDAAAASVSQCRLAGVDYSADAVRLAKTVARTRDPPPHRRCGCSCGEGYEKVRFEEVHFLAEKFDVEKLVLLSFGEGVSTSASTSGEVGAWDVVLDKGTYDAMALAGRDEQGKRPVDVYPRRVGSLVKKGGFFLITSCNFTKEELLRTFETTETGLTYHSQIEFPSISFGGVQGSTYCGVAFQKTEKKG